MKAIRCNRFAALERDESGKFRLLKQWKSLRSVLSLDSSGSIPTQDDQVLPEDHVLIQTHYAGIQYPDALQAQGLYQVKPPLPYIPGLDLSGVVIQSSTSKFRNGDRVMATTIQNGGTGACSEYCMVPSHQVWTIPPNLHLSQCANIGRNYFAAYHSLKNIGNIGKDSLIFVDGASGGVGMATIELAKAMGAKVIAGVSSESKLQVVQTTSSADHVLCYGTTKESHQLFKKRVKKIVKEMGHAEGVDLAVDVVQGELFESIVSIMRPLGTICLVGFTAGQKPIRPGLLLIKEVNVVGSIWGRWANANPQLHRQNVDEILQYFANGSIIPRTSRVFPLERFYEAFELFETNQGQGNTVIQFKEEEKGSMDLLSKL